MESLPADLCLKIFCWLDHQNLATAQQVCKKWKVLASDNVLWSNLFQDRWGGDRAAFYAPVDSKLWKHAYEVQDRCDRIGLGLKIIREGGDYYLVHQGEIQRYLGSRRKSKRATSSQNSKAELTGDQFMKVEESCCRGILDKILFFIGDLEVASADAKRGRIE
ncbi:hypothetical protein P3X46_017344 [Hevea brasiliensis]|uniref:F-box protein n=1 Tax=Hevea brasiliensis TaxID=3981 RepID=A0ABQ9M1Z4_HEVBR|nr:probable E3 ubiquitin ligase complex SCF subunit sconB isoform X1 [Hevea brasiliensis]KAJ9174307.1 hypothetical protein P3X46_017344 [Hevea brasiliensis]